MKNGIYRVDHTADPDRGCLSEVWKWAQVRPDLYLDGSGYEGAEAFAQPPVNAVEYFVFVEGDLVALLTFIRKSSTLRIYQVGLIVRPGAPYRRLLRMLDGFRAHLSNYADVLQVELPLDACFDRSRRLARRFKFEQAGLMEFFLAL